MAACASSRGGREGVRGGSPEELGSILLVYGLAKKKKESEVKEMRKHIKRIRGEEEEIKERNGSGKAIERPTNADRGLKAAIQGKKLSSPQLIHLFILDFPVETLRWMPLLTQTAGSNTSG